MSEIDKEKENINFELPNIFSDSVISANLIRSIWLFNIPSSHFYLSVLDKQKSLSIIDSIFGHPPPIQCKRVINESQYNWLAYCLRKLIAPQESTKLDEYKILLSYLLKSRGNYVTNIKRFFSIRQSRLKSFFSNSGNQNIAFFDSSGDEMIIFQTIFELYTEEPALFFSFRKCNYDKKLDTFTTSNPNLNDSNSIKDTSNQSMSLLPDYFTFPECEARLIAKLGNRLLECCPSISPILLRALKNDDLETLFGLPCIYSNPKCIDTASQFQKAFFSIRRFPLVSFFANSSSLVALFNTSAVTDHHFVDLFMKPALDFVSQSKFEEAVKICHPFIEMADYASLLAIDKEKKIDDTNFMSHVINTHFEGLSTSSSQISASNSESISASSSMIQTANETESYKTTNELFQRFKGDICVIDDVRNYLGTLTSLAKLREESIPKIFISFLQSENFEPFSTMRSRILYSVKDEDWTNDSDFVSGYFALVNTLKVFETNDESCFECIEFHIRKIESIEFLNRLSIDIFSLLFVTKTQNETDAPVADPKQLFFVNKETAERILRILIDTDNSDDENNVLLPYLSSALRKIQFANVLYPDEQTVRAIMEPIEGMFALALEKKEIGIFSKIAHSDEKEGGKIKLKGIVDVAKQVVEFQQKEEKDFNELRNDSKIEIISSFELTKDELNKLYSEIDFNSIQLKDELKSILSNKQRIIKSSTENLQLSFERLTKSNFFHEISNRLSISSLENENNWEPLMATEESDLIDDDNNSLFSFVSNLDNLLPPLIQATNEKVAKCLDLDPLIAVTQLVNEGKIEQASSLSHSLGYSVTEAIMRSGSTTHQCLSLLANENSVLSSFLVLNSKLKRDEFSDEFLGNSQILSNFLTRLDDNEFESLDQILEQDLKNQNGCSTNEINSQICSRLINRPIQISELSELLYRITEDDFINLIMNSKVLFNYDVSDFDSLLKLCELNGFERTYKIFEVFINASKLTNRKPFPLEEIFSILILNSPNDNQSLTLANELFENCKSYFNPHESIQSAIVELSKRNQMKEIVQIINMDFENANDILNNLSTDLSESISSFIESNQSNKPKSNHANLIDSLFFESVPDSWQLKETPIRTIVENASDTSNALRLISVFPSIQQPINDKFLRVVSKHASVDLPIEKRASKIAADVRNFLPLISSREQKMNLIEHASKQLILLTSQLSSYDPHSELTSFNSLNRIFASFNSVQNESRKLNILNENKPFKSISMCLAASLHFVSYFPCTKFNAQYSFEDFLEKETGETIAKFCFDFDFIEIAKQAADAWNIDGYDNLKDRYALKCVKLGIDKIPFKSKFKGFPVFERPPNPNSNDEDSEENDRIFSIWKFATDRKGLGASSCTSEESFGVVRDFISSYRHLSFYDSRICGRLTNLASVEQILESEFQSADAPQGQDQGGKEESSESDQITAQKSSPSIFSKLFKSSKRKQVSASPSSSSSFDINKYVDDDGELCNQHFYARLSHLCASSLVGDSELIEAQPSDYISSELSDVLLRADRPSPEMSERLFPGTPAQLSSYLSARAPFFEEARYHSSIGEFSTALTILEEKLTDESPEDNWNCFIDDVYSLAVQRDRAGLFFSSAMDFVEMHGPSSKMRSMIEKLLELSQKVENIPLTELGSLLSLGRFELAAFTAVSLLKSTTTRFSRLLVIDVAFASAATFFKKPSIENSEDIEKVRELKKTIKLASIESTSDSRSALYALMNLLNIQRRFVLSADGGYLNIFDGAATFDSMAAFLFLQQEIKFAVELMSSYPDSVKITGVASTLVDILANESDEKIRAVVATMEKEAPKSIFKSIVFHMISRAYFFIKDDRLIGAIVHEVGSLRFKCGLFILTGKLEEAFKVAADAATEYLPLIANYAAKECKLQLMADVVKAIERCEKNEKE